MLVHLWTMESSGNTGIQLSCCAGALGPATVFINRARN